MALDSRNGEIPQVRCVSQNYVRLLQKYLVKIIVIAFPIDVYK